MKSVESNIFKLLEMVGDGQMVIPIYQRRYSWEEKQCTQLWDDMVSSWKRSGNHFCGSVINIDDTPEGAPTKQYTIIDGQQRVTTLVLMLTALRDWLREKGAPDSDDAEKLDGLLRRRAGGYKLLMTETDQAVMGEMLKGYWKSSGNEASLVTGNYRFFREQMEKTDLSAKDLMEAIRNLVFVLITLGRGEDDPQAVFDRLNSAGKTLTDTDRIRNYLLMGLDPQKQRAIYAACWRPMETWFPYGKREKYMEEFLRDYLTMWKPGGQTASRDRIYEEFRDFYQERGARSGIYEFVQELCEYAGYYTEIRFAKTEDRELRQLYEDVEGIKMAVAYPFLIRVRKDLSERRIKDNEWKEILRICISYVLRRRICGLASNSHDSTFAGLYERIRQDDCVASVREYFRNLPENKRFPDDEEFGRVLVSADLYHMNAINKYFLERLENDGKKGALSMEEYSIEHIMPQNPDLNEAWKKDLGQDWKNVQEKYLHTLGNLTLTAYNPELSDSSFQEKLDMEGGFRENGLRLNAEVVRYTVWNEERILHRARSLAERVKEIWPGLG